MIDLRVPVGEGRVYAEVEDWRSRLRSRIEKRKGRSISFGGGATRKEKESLKKVSSETGSGSQTIGHSTRGRRRVLSYEVNAKIEETKCQIEFLPSSDQQESGEEAHQEDLKIVTDSLVYPNEEIEAPLPSGRGGSHLRGWQTMGRGEEIRAERGLALERISSASRLVESELGFVLESCEEENLCSWRWWTPSSTSLSPSRC